MLTGCAKQVSYAEFHDAATKVEATPNTKAVVTVKGSYGSENYDGHATFVHALGVWAPKLADGDDTAVSLVFAFVLNATAATVVETENTKYYVGGGFEVKDDNGSMKFDKYGYMTSMSAKDLSVKVSYSN